MCRKTFISVAFLLLIGFQTQPAVAVGEQKQDALVLGILPYLSPTVLLKTWEPFIGYLERQTGRHVYITSAPDFNTYIRRAATGLYDIYETAPHFALLAEKKYHYRRLARLKRELDGTILVLRNTKINSIEDLKGKVFATPDKLAIITILGELTLLEHGVRPQIDITIKYTPSHNNALISVIEGTADAAVTSTAEYERMNPVKKNQLRVLAKTRQVPHMMIMAGPRLDDKEYTLLSKLILQFTANGPGERFFQDSGYGDMVKITDNDMARLSPLIPLLDARVKE